jgi:hypothetical protein
MLEDELTPDDAVVGSEDERTSPPTDGEVDTLKLSRDLPHGRPTGQQCVFTMLVAIACVVFGSKLIVISALGSPIPLLDQWDAEAATLYSPYLRGELSFANLLTPHNDHRIVVTRLLALLHLELAGEWNTRLEMVLGAIVHTALITWLAALLMPLVVPQRRILVACFIAFLFAVPIGYENTLWGFQSQLYLTLLFAIAALAAFAVARPFSLRWLGGLSAAVLSYFSFATGLATIFGACLLLGLQLAMNARNRCGRELAAVAIIAIIGVAGAFWAASIAVPTSTPWTFIQGLLVLGALTVIGVAPMVWFCVPTLARHPATRHPAWVVVGFGGWLAIQLVLLAYGRGVVIAVRYMDIVLLVYPVALVAVLGLADRVQTTQLRRYALRAAVAWVFIVVSGFALLGYASVLGAINWSKSAHQQMADVQAYLASGSIEDLKAQLGGGHTVNLAYPHPKRLANILGDPEVRTVLPRQIRPSDADNAAARSHMWLKGSLAEVTRTALHVVLSVGPILLALGGGVLFAVGARQSLISARR